MSLQRKNNLLLQSGIVKMMLALIFFLDFFLKTKYELRNIVLLHDLSFPSECDKLLKSGVFDYEESAFYLPRHSLKALPKS